LKSKNTTLIQDYCKRAIFWSYTIKINFFFRACTTSTDASIPCHHAALLDPFVWFYRHYKNRVGHTDPWPDPMRPKSLTRDPNTRL